MEIAVVTVRSAGEYGEHFTGWDVIPHLPHAGALPLSYQRVEF